MTAQRSAAGFPLNTPTALYGFSVLKAREAGACICTARCELACDMPTGEGCLNLCGRGDGVTVAITPVGADRFIELIPNVK